MKRSVVFPKNSIALLALILLSILLLGSIFAPVLAPYDPVKINMLECMQGISFNHPLGTDLLGRDLFSRVLYGGRVSILLAVAATTLSMFIGMILGILAGYFGGKMDAVITCCTSIFQGLPGVSMMIAVSALLGNGTASLLIALVINSWTGFSRIVRAHVMNLKERTYVEGARALGAGSVDVIIRYIVPNMMPDIVVLFTTRVGGVVLSIASLSFLGLGIQPPTPDWGVMINEARGIFRSAPMTLLAPGICIFILTFGINYLGETLRIHFDIKNRSLRNF